MIRSIRRLLAILSLSVWVFGSAAQGTDNPVKPYKLLTSGKQITIKSTIDIKHIMLWTTSGNRVIEQKEINRNSFAVNIPTNHKAFYLMIGLSDGKIYTEKIAIP